MKILRSAMTRLLTPGGKGAGYACLLLLCLVATYRFVLFSPSGTVSGRYDIYRYYGPITYLLDYGVHHGEFPLWNPLIYCGLPNAPDPQAFLYYPPNLVRSLLNFHPTPYSTQASFVILLGLHLLFMGLCTLRLGRMHGLRDAGALTAALAFTFGALMVRRACEYHFIFTLSWLPLLLILTKRMLDAGTWRDSLRLALVAGVLLGISILGGFLQIITYMGLCIGVYAAGYRLLHPKVDGAVWRVWPRDAAGLVLMVGLSGLVAAVLLMPTWELASFTARQKGAAIPMYSDLQQKTLAGFAKSFLLYAGDRYECEGLRVSGIIALVLSLAGLTHRRWRETVPFAVLYVVLFDCSLGPPFPCATVLDWFTPFASSAYSRACDFGVLPLALLAGFGVDALCAATGRRWQPVARLVGVVTVGALIIWVVFGWISAPGFAWKVSRWAIYVPMAGVIVMAAGGFVRPRWICCWALPLLLLGETLVWNDVYVPYLTRKPFKEDPGLFTGEAVFAQENTRRSDPISNRYMYSMTMCMNGVAPLNIQRARDVVSGPPRDKSYHRLVTRSEVTETNTRGNLLFKRQFWLARQWVKGELPPKSALYPSATTVFLTEGGDASVPELGRAAVKPSALSENVSVQAIPASGGKSSQGRTLSKVFQCDLPLCSEQGQTGSAGARHSAMRIYYTASSSATLLTSFMNRETKWVEPGRKMTLGVARDKERMVEVPMPDFARIEGRITIKPAAKTADCELKRIEVVSDMHDEDALIQIQKRGINSVDLTVGELTGARYLVFTDTNYPGWKAWVDGKPVPIVEADNVFKAVLLPAGRHTVRFAFSAPAMYRGLVISLLAVGIAGGLAFGLWRRKDATVACCQGTEEVVDGV